MGMQSMVKNGGKGRSTEIRLEMPLTKKSTISFGARRDDSRIYLVSFCSSSRYAMPVRSYSVSLIIGRAITPARVCTAYRGRIVSISHQCRLQNPFLLLQLRGVPYRGNITKHALPSPLTGLVINVPHDGN